MYFIDYNSQSLAHYGVKGMRWGHRKDRNTKLKTAARYGLSAAGLVEAGRIAMETVGTIMPVMVAYQSWGMPINYLAMQGLATVGGGVLSGLLAGVSIITAKNEWNKYKWPKHSEMRRTDA